jgi:hypothetical protein
MAILLPLLLALAHLQPLIIPGEHLTYEVTSARFGKLGHAEFSVTVLPSGSLELAFDFDARVLLFKASDHTRSVLEPITLRTLQYSKRERSPVGKRDEIVMIDHATSTWNGNGLTRPLASEDALDELSFIYLVRSLELAPGEERILPRHFDAARNPVKARAIASDEGLDVIEMQVPDKRQQSGFSILRFHLSRDERRLPIRIESTMPLAGRVTMTLVSTE